MKKTQNFKFIHDYLAKNNISYELISEKNDLDIFSNELLGNNTLINHLINKVESKQYTFITKIIPNPKGNVILYFCNFSNKEEIVIDIHSKDKMFYKNVLFYFFKIRNLFSLYFQTNKENFNFIHGQFSKTLLPIKYYRNFNLTILYYLSRGCIVLKLSKKEIENKKLNDLFL